ncbi:LysR family transcriptional regulator [Marinovum sp. 2_MG-2023]|uniref:LysR family transcriptional regulator n=1 Tax=unclassified Marinovum TaxID=2647166 RepID=UPI0026E370AD|nr:MULTISPECIES: LysR family transcriptional regulator [unclassified Marinovum]MDO6730041.1 LysR family transcriptional regulator [Marinovum sp. 2_MG-2023]MDO6779855.1 LysR family transcriptional regulator [Marinovum sp. 1_MG-2023]
MFKIDTVQSASFLVACEEGSIRSASERLGVEPSTISRQIKALEDSLGTALIERGRRGVRATEAGILLRTYLKHQQSEQEALLSDFDALKGMRRGELVIAVGDGFISDFVGNAVKSYKAAFPGFTYDLLSGSTEQVLHAVRTDRAHLGLAYNARTERAIRSVAQVKQPLDLLVSPTSEWADLPEPVTMAQLETLPSALLKSGFGVGDMIAVAEGAHGVRLQALVRSNSLAVLRNFVREGLGVTVLPAFVVTREIADGTIITKSLDIPEFSKGEASVFTRQGRRLPEGATRLVNHISRSMVAFRHST